MFVKKYFRYIASFIFILILLIPKSVDAQLNTKDENIPLLQVYRHQPTYFISGVPNTKLQLSLKLQLIRNAPVFVGYTQLAVWDLFVRKSSPIRDINFNPEFFYRLSFDPQKNINH
jgi:outer membrane phospholipase A